jgi:hypothetical protein
MKPSLNKTIDRKKIDWILRIAVSGNPIWDFIECWPNVGAPLALLYVRQLPMSIKELFTK